jgi:hypothetical protein
MLATQAFRRAAFHAYRLRPTQAVSPRHLNVVNYITTKPAVPYQDLTIGTCGEAGTWRVAR